MKNCLREDLKEISSVETIKEGQTDPRKTSADRRMIAIVDDEDLQKRKASWRIRIMCILCTPRPIYLSTYRQTYRSSVGRHIDRCSTDMSTDTRPIYRSRCVGRHINRHINRDIGRHSTDMSVDMSTESCCPTVGRHVDR